MARASQPRDRGACALTCESSLLPRQHERQLVAGHKVALHAARVNDDRADDAACKEVEEGAGRRGLRSARAVKEGAQRALFYTDTACPIVPNAVVLLVQRRRAALRRHAPDDPSRAMACDSAARTNARHSSRLMPGRKLASTKP